jgi:tight adherence protein B
MHIAVPAFMLGALSWLVLILHDRRKHSIHTADSKSSATNNPALNKDYKSVPLGLVHYDDYQLSSKERLAAVLMMAIPMLIIGYVFYKSMIVAILLSAIGLIYPKFRRKQLIRIRKNKLNVQFKQALSCLSSSLSAGKSIETAFREALEDLRVLYPDPACFIVNEFGIIGRRLENGEPIEAAILDFSKRANLEDATSFADVFVTCKRTGGNLIEVMKRTAGIIGEKLEIKQDISVMIAQKRFESRVLLFAPILIVAVLSFSSPEYMIPLYQGIGVFIMSFCLLLLGACGWLTQKIMDIKV